MTSLEKICQCFQAHGIPYAVVGGYAVALHGAPRGTLDIDFIIPLEERFYLGVEKALQSIGMRSRLPVTAKEIFNFRNEYIENRNLIAWSFYNPADASEVVDIIITEDLNNCFVLEKNFAKMNVKVISKKDLIRMKKKSGRPQDLIDIQSLEKL